MTDSRLNPRERFRGDFRTRRKSLDPTVNYSFPGNDYALVRYDNTSLTALLAPVASPVAAGGAEAVEAGKTSKV